jgi:hypothetical protein
MHLGRRKKVQGSSSDLALVEKDVCLRELATELPSADSSITYEDAGSHLHKTPALVARARDLIRQAYHEHMLHAPKTETLPMLIRLNVLNALAQNAIAMGFSPAGLCQDDWISPFNSHGPHLPGSTAILEAACPSSLRPTAVQRMVRHHPWIDLFPFPALRDNILRAMDDGSLDDDDLCFDILEVWGEDIETRPCLVIWGDPSDGRAWEASPSFLRKWGWLLPGCPGLVDSTNYWRKKRGQARLDSGRIVELC